MGKPQLGFGIMRLPYNGEKIDYVKTEAIIEEYMRGEYCYFDVHPAYMSGNSQRILKKYVVDKYNRSAYYVANKMPYYGINSYEDYERIFEEELFECGIEYFDYYMLHAITADVYELHEKKGGFDFIKKKKEEGKIRQIGISFHDKPELLEKILKNHTELDFVQLQINFYDWNSPVICAKENYEIARKFNKKIMVMEPIKGGSLVEFANEKNMEPADIARISLNFIKRLSGVEIVLSGMSETKQVKENRETLKSKENVDNKEVYEELVLRINKCDKIPCTKCKYCVRECPKEIAIPDIISVLNEYVNRKSGIIGGEISTYRAATYKKGKAGDCIKCGKCEKVCPQKIEIRKYMEVAKNRCERFEKKICYSSERNVQQLVYLLKKHNIKKIVVSPGATNICFVQSIQYDGEFEIYSSADERSAAYIACGLAEESGEPVALSCTGATASRNYIPGLTEAYYRKLPILAITSSQPIGRIGHNVPQMIDRTSVANDIALMSVQVPLVRDDETEWECNVNINKALLELRHNGGGPVHLNLVTSYDRDFSVNELPNVRFIRRLNNVDKLPDITGNKIAIFCGAHSRWSDDEISMVDKFCEKYNAVVIQDHTGNYHGRYGVLGSLIFTQEMGNDLNYFDILIHIGNISGAYFPLKMREVWRINQDGKVCDTFRKLTYVFEMKEKDFFKKYVEKDIIEVKKEEQEIAVWNKEYDRIYSKISNLPFSNTWIAYKTANRLPANSVVHLGILNSLRNWNFFKMDNSIDAYSNTGGFGIDGCVSSLLGASLCDTNKLYYGIVGDLAFFYDMNAMGNRHIGNNVRLFVISNGCGTEFKNYNHMAALLKEDADNYVAAKGHYGNKSSELLKNYVENLGFSYLSASTKEEYECILPNIVSPTHQDKPMVIEIFTTPEDESYALKIINTLDGEKSSINQVNKKVAIPKRYENIQREVVLWGAGGCFDKNLSKVEKFCKIRYVCDKNNKLWGREVAPGVICISPDELSKMKGVFVVIMQENMNVAFMIANQLLEMGITEYDIVYNWLDYATNMKYI